MKLHGTAGAIDLARLRHEVHLGDPQVGGVTSGVVVWGGSERRARKRLHIGHIGGLDGFRVVGCWVY